MVAAGDFYARGAQAPDRPQAEKELAFEQARRAYNQALQSDPNYLPAQVGLARCYVGLNDLPRAQTAYERALTVAPNSPVVWHDLSIVYLRQKDWETALKCLDQAVSFDPENRQYQNTLGWALARAGREDEAFACFSRLHGPVQAHHKLARMMQHTQQHEAARQHLEAALQLDPQSPETLALLKQLNSPVVPASAHEVQQKPATDPGLPPQVEPVRTVIFQQASKAPAELPRFPNPPTLEPNPFQEDAVEPAPLPIEPVDPEMPRGAEPEPSPSEPMRLLPAPPRVR